MQRLHYNLHFLRNRELNELYISVAIKSFASSMITIFIPIFLLKLDYSLTHVLIFYAILNATHALFVIPAAKISSIYGYKPSLFFSIPILIVFYLTFWELRRSLNFIFMTLSITLIIDKTRKICVIFLLN